MVENKGDKNENSDDEKNLSVELEGENVANQIKIRQKNMKNKQDLLQEQMYQWK